MTNDDFTGKLYDATDGIELPEYKLLRTIGGVYEVLNTELETWTIYTPKEFFKLFSFTPLQPEDEHDSNHPQAQDRLLAAEHYTTIYN